MGIINYGKLPSIKSLKEILLCQSALDIIMNDEENAWLRVTIYQKNYFDEVDLVTIDNGSGDHMHILFTKDGVIIKGFDHESILTPYANDNHDIAKGIYDEVPDQLMELLKDESLESEDVTFCIWRGKEDLNWNKGDVIVPEEYTDSDDGEGFLLGFIFEDSEDWLHWANDYYEAEIPLDIVKIIYENKGITRYVIEKMNPTRDIDEALKELDEIGYFV